MPVQVIQSEQGWPLPWYLRDLTHVGYQSEIPAKIEAPVVVVDADREAAVRKILGDGWESSTWGLRAGITLTLLVNTSAPEKKPAELATNPDAFQGPIPAAELEAAASGVPDVGTNPTPEGASAAAATPTGTPVPLPPATGTTAAAHSRSPAHAGAAIDPPPSPSKSKKSLTIPTVIPPKAEPVSSKLARPPRLSPCLRRRNSWKTIRLLPARPARSPSAGAPDLSSPSKATRPKN